MWYEQLRVRAKRNIDRLVSHYESNIHLFENFARGLALNLETSPRLGGLIHFLKYRVKDTDHLRQKLARKIIEDSASREITIETLFETVNDLAGVRLIHLHTEQMAEIHPAILSIFEEQNYRLFEEPTANVWDVELEGFFGSLGIQTRSRDTMYTTVHYVIEANQRTKITCELQVRTLMDEVWGEVSHKVNYPEPTKSAICAAQLRTLARFTTGCARLVDSIFQSHKSSPQGSV